MKAVLKLGGFAFPPELSTERISAYSQIIKAFSKKNTVAVVTGAGPTARRYIEAARRLGASEAVCDQIGIRVSRINARLLTAALRDSAVAEIPESLEDFVRFLASGLIVVMGGLQPGQSTNAVAALVAEVMHADLLVNATDVDGVYDADPRKDPRAKKLKEVSVEDLISILSTQGVRAGEYALLDPVALRIIQRSRIPVVVVDGRDVSNVERVLGGKRVGTRIVPTK